MSGDKGLSVDAVRRFEHHTGGIDWYCEQRGEGPPIVLVPSGEGDCASFEKVAADLANDFTVLTFDIPGFSRSHVRSPDDVSLPKLADQIVDLTESLSLSPATFYGCSSGGFAVLDLVVRHPNAVQNAIVHEVADAAAATPLLSLAALDDAAIVETCKFAYAQIMNDDVGAWEALGDEYHARLAKNYVTWVRRYLTPPLPPSHAPDELVGKPVTWTIGGITPAATFFGNVVLAVKSRLPISVLMCKHFPQVSAPAMLAEHIRSNSLAT